MKKKELQKVAHQTGNVNVFEAKITEISWSFINAAMQICEENKTDLNLNHDSQHTLTEDCCSNVQGTVPRLKKAILALCFYSAPPRSGTLSTVNFRGLNLIGNTAAVCVLVEVRVILFFYHFYYVFFFQSAVFLPRTH